MAPESGGGDPATPAEEPEQTPTPKRARKRGAAKTPREPRPKREPKTPRARSRKKKAAAAEEEEGKPEAGGEAEAPPADGEAPPAELDGEQTAEKPAADAASPAKPKRRSVQTGVETGRGDDCTGGRGLLRALLQGEQLLTFFVIFVSLLRVYFLSLSVANNVGPSWS